MFLIQRLALLFLFALPSFLPNTAYAIDDPADVTGWLYSGGTTLFPSALEACTGKLVELGLTQYTAKLNTTATQTSYSCLYTHNNASFTTVSVQASCPSNATKITLSGVYYCRYADCVAPQVFNTVTNACAAPCLSPNTTNPTTGVCEPPPCEAGCTGVCGSSYKLNVTNLPSTTCINNCNYNTGDGIAGSTGGWLFIVGRNLGTSCTPPTPLPDTAPPSCPECDCIKSGKSYGTVNGTVVCTTLGSTGSAPAVIKTSSTSTSSGSTTSSTGEPTTSSTETQQDTIRIYNGDGTVSSSTQASTSNSDGSTSTTTGTKTQSTDDFCSENPTSEACKQQSQCEENPNTPACKHFCEEYPNSVTCADFNTFWEEAASLPADGGIITQSKDLTFDTVDIQGNNSCPVPVNLSFGGHSISVSYNWLCEYAESFRPVVIAFAYLAAIAIFFGAFRRGS
jgi:hypothetical protein